MTNAPFIVAAAALAGVWLPAPASARSASFAQASAAADHTDDGDAELPPYLQCVPYARQVSGIQIFGDAHTWWDQADGRYARGDSPAIGAVMTFRPHRNMRLGHVAAVSKVIDSRTVLLRHSNWSPINGRRGQIEDDVRAIDVSPANDWSMVRVWYAPIDGIGSTEWPVAGFIYPGKGKRGERSGSVPRIARVPAAKPAPAPIPEPSRSFLSAFAELPTSSPASAATGQTRAPTPQPAKASGPKRSGDRIAAAQSPAEPPAKPLRKAGSVADSPADLLGLLTTQN